MPPRATPIPIPALAPDDKPPELLLGTVVEVAVLCVGADVAVPDVDVVVDVVALAAEVTLFQTSKLGDQAKNPDRGLPSTPRLIAELKRPN